MSEGVVAASRHAWCLQAWSCVAARAGRAGSVSLLTRRLWLLAGCRAALAKCSTAAYVQVETSSMVSAMRTGRCSMARSRTFSIGTECRLPSTLMWFAHWAGW